MFAIMFFAAGLAVAGLVGSRRVERVGERVAAGGGSANRGLADERGITLQTLIVTAVLVLMAVAAGVVIVAITNSSSDDLEESGTDVQSRCNEVEIYDPVVASRNEIGVNIGEFHQEARPLAVTMPTTMPFEFEGSGIGCIPVCIWRDKSPNAASDAERAKPNGILEPGEVVFVRDLLEANIVIRRNRRLDARGSGDVNLANYVLKSGSSREQIEFVAHSTSTEVVTFPVLDTDGETTPNQNSNGDIAGPIDRVAVASNQNECHTYDSGGNVLL